ncbi:MAG: hypothetical protein RLP15_11250 [Cryomorphaceae bacterium]
MKASKYIAFILLFVPFGLKAQLHFPKERVTLSIDRAVYFGQESIRFAAVIQMKEETWEPTVSTVLYTDIHTSDGMLAARCKTSIMNGKSEGSIHLNENMVSGSYVIRSYTQYQASASTNELCFIPFTLINPLLRADKSLARPKQQTAIEAIELVSYEVDEDGLLLSMERENIELLTIRVVKASLSSDAALIAQSGDIGPVSLGLEHREVPDIRGLLLSGELFDINSGLPISDTRVLATVVSDFKQLHVSRTDERGRFAFSLPQTAGKHDVYVCALRPQSEVDVLITDEFAKTTSDEWISENIPSNWEQLSAAFVDHQLCVDMLEDWSRPAPAMILEPPYPLSAPSVNVKTSDFVALSSVSQLLDEIVPMVSARKQNGIPYVHVFDPSTKRSYDDPLLMVDHLPIQDATSFLSTPIERIESIDVFAEELVIGQEVFKGCVNLNTRPNANKSTALPSNCVVVEYLTLTPTLVDVQAPKKSAPDVCNTLFWKVLDGDTQPVQVPLTTADLGEYRMIVTGLGRDGKCYFQEILLQP